MGSFVKNNWVYIFIGFALVLVIGLGFLVYQRMQELNSGKTSTEEKTELSFSLEQKQPGSVECLELSATPQKGSAPLTVSFVGRAQGTQGDTLFFSYVFGDNTTLEVERLITSTDGVETQAISHTYTTPGSYTAELTLSASDTVSTPCSTIIAVTGVSENIDTGSTALSPTPTTTVLAKGATLTPTKPTPSPTVTSIKTPTPTRAVVPTLEKTSADTDNNETAVPEIPKAGGFLPTVILTAGGIAVLLLAFFL